MNHVKFRIGNDWNNFEWAFWCGTGSDLKAYEIKFVSHSRYIKALKNVDH